jgi:hypothetical protein
MLGHEHPPAGDVERDTDSLHQIAEHPVLVELAVDGCPIHRGATGRIAAIRPIKDTIREIELEIDWLGQTFKKGGDIAAIGGGLP